MFSIRPTPDTNLLQWVASCGDRVKKITDIHRPLKGSGRQRPRTNSFDGECQEKKIAVLVHILPTCVRPRLYITEPRLCALQAAQPRVRAFLVPLLITSENPRPLSQKVIHNSIHRGKDRGLNSNNNRIAFCSATAPSGTVRILDESRTDSNHSGILSRGLSYTF